MNRWTRFLALLTTVAALLGCSGQIGSRLESRLPSASVSQPPSPADASLAPAPTVFPPAGTDQPGPSPDQRHLAFGDHAASNYLWINLDPTSSFKGRFVFAADGRGLFWGKAPADFTSQPDGSVTVSYDGPGWHDPAGTFDPLLWMYEVNGDPSPVPLRLHGVVGPDRSTASAQLSAQGRTYELKDGAPMSGADAAMIEIAELVAVEDWASLYLRTHDSLKASVEEPRFVSAMKDGTVKYGSITSATVTSRARVADTGLGWDVATAGLDLTFSKGGRITTYPVTVELMADGKGWWLIGISRIDGDAAGIPGVTTQVTPGLN